MSSRSVPVIVGAAGFLVTLMLCAWHGGFWQQSGAPAGVAVQPTPRPNLALPQTVADPMPMHTVGSGPTARPVSAPNDDRALVTDDSTASPADEREVSERHRDDVRGARTR